MAAQVSLPLLSVAGLGCLGAEAAAASAHALAPAPLTGGPAPRPPRGPLVARALLFAVQCAPRAPAETPCPQAPGVPPELIKPHAPAPGWNDPQRGARSPQRQRAEVRHHSPMGRPSAVGYGSHSNQNPPYMPQQPHNPPQVRRRARAHTNKHTHTHTHTHTRNALPVHAPRGVLAWG